MDVDFRVLGPLEVCRADVPLDVGAPKQRTVLALLVLHAGQPVPAARFVDELWPAGAPNSAVANVTTYLSRLRRTLDAAGCRLERRHAGHVLHVGPDAVDRHRFVAHAGRGDTAWRAGTAAAAARHWQEALTTWRGLPFEGLPTGPALTAARAEWHEQRLTVLELHTQALLRLGRHADAVAQLRRHTLAEPFRESGWLLLMAALRLGGSPAAALDAYEQARAVLGEHLGVDPGARLRAMHRAVLADDATAVSALLDGKVTAPAPAPPKAPAQLPLDVHGFTGRAAQLARLDAALDGSAEQSTAVVITAVSGTAGVGKTALALHWAHRRAGRFPGGQLYVNLRGFDPDGSSTTPGKALRGFLDALDVPTERIPVDVDAQAALYRSLMAGRRMLVVLDNARNAEQVRLLLPGAAGCLVLVTSRNRLTSLVTREGARPVMLDLLEPCEARQLLARRLGEARLAAEPGAVEEMIARCAGLPLALAIVAARAATAPGCSLTVLAGQLREARGSLDAFAGDGDDVDLRAVFSWSYRELTAPAARLFRLLGRHPGGDIAAAAAASLAGDAEPAVRRSLAELTRANLLTEHAPGRYTMHDLLRSYAAELHGTEDTDAGSRAALHRLLEHYAHTSHAAAMLLAPHRAPLHLDPIAPGATAHPLDSREEAMVWLARERAGLVAAVELAAAHGFHRHTTTLAWALSPYFARQGHGHDWLATQAAALRSAEQAGDLPAQADAHRALLRAHGRLGRQDAARTHFERAVEVYGQLGDHRGQGHCHLNFAHTRIHAGDAGEALQLNRQALALYRVAGDVLGQADALNSVGWASSLLGEHEQTLTHCREALTLLRAAGAPAREGNTLDSMGHAYHHLGRHEEAFACYHQALEVFRAAGDHYNETEILSHLGDAQLAVGDVTGARDSWQAALAIIEDAGHADVTDVRGKLQAL